MDSSAAYVDSFGGGGGGGDETYDLFVGVDGESEELTFSWGANVDSGKTGLGDHAVLSCPKPLADDNTTTRGMEEDVFPGCVRTNVVKPCIAKNKRPRAVVNDPVSSSRPTGVVSRPSNNDQGRVHMDMGTMRSGIRVAPEAESQERKKRERWNIAEHRFFLMGLKQYGKKWTKISQDYIPWNTPLQLSSHAQKYFIRQEKTAKNWIRYTVNNVSEKGLTSGDDSRLSPKQQPPLAATSLPMHGGSPSMAQQSLSAAMSQTGVNGSSSMPLPAHNFIRFSSPVGEPAPVQQSFGGVSMQGPNIGGPVLHQTNIGGWSSSHLQPFHHLGGTEWNYSNPMVRQEFVPWNQMPQLVAALPEYYSPAPHMPWNYNMDVETPEQHPFTDEDGSLDFDGVPNDYLAYYWRYP